MGIKLCRVLSVIAALPFFCSFSNIQHDNFSEEEISCKSDFLCHSFFHIGNLQAYKEGTLSNMIHRYLTFSAGEHAKVWALGTNAPCASTQTL